MGMGAEEALGKRLQQARQRAGLTQQELCQKASLSYSTLAKIERGAIKAPSVFTVATISQATGVPLEELLDIQTGPATPAKKTSKTGVKFVYFDLNQTLVQGYEKAFTAVAADAGMSVDKVEMYFWRYNAAVNSSELSLDDFNKATAQAFNLPGMDWSQYYLQAVTPVPGMPELVRWAAEHYRVGILSGTMPRVIKGLLENGTLPAVDYDQIIDSSEVKLLKTSPKIFQLAQDKAGVAASEILLVDDDVRALTLADELGWQATRFDNYDPSQSIERIKQHLAF